MRFHIGVSKSFKIKTIIKILFGIGFLILSTLGLQRVNAETTWYEPFNNTNFITEIDGYYLDGAHNFDPTDYTVPLNYVHKGCTNGYCYVDVDSSSFDRFFNVAITKYYKNFGTPYNTIAQQRNFRFYNNNFCQNSSSELKSMNVEFILYISKMSGFDDNLSYFNQSSVDDTFGVRIRAYDTNGNNYGTTCTKQVLNNSYSRFYNVTCNGVFQGNSNYEIDHFDIEISNTIPFNDYYSDTNDNRILSFENFQVGSYWLPSGFSHSFAYSCSDEEPSLMEPLPGGIDDADGLDDIYDSILDNYDENVPGLYTYIEKPRSFIDFVKLPYNLLNAINESSDSCTPYTIDLSSLANLSSSTSGNTYSLSIPCMRSHISGLIGSTFYNIIDVLLCAVIIYKFINILIICVESITSGEDLFTTFFNPNESLINKKSRGDN